MQNMLMLSYVQKYAFPPQFAIFKIELDNKKYPKAEFVQRHVWLVN